MRFVRSGRGDIRLGFCVVVRGKLYGQFGEGWCVEMLGKAEGRGSNQGSEGIQVRFVVDMVWCALVYG